MFIELGGWQTFQVRIIVRMETESMLQKATGT